MQRRAFMNLTGGAVTALAFEPFAVASAQGRRWQQETSPVPYPDAAMEVVDPRFAKYKVNNAAVEPMLSKLWKFCSRRGRSWPRRSRSRTSFSGHWKSWVWSG